jgi:hypothetical protein
MIDEAEKRRFLLFAMFRITGALLFIAGVAITFSDLVQPRGAPLIGIPLACLGLAEALSAPRLVRRLTGS